LSEVSRGHSRWDKKPGKKKPEAFTHTEGLNEQNERKGKVQLLVLKAEPRKRTTYLRIGWKLKVKSKRSLINKSI